MKSAWDTRRSAPYTEIGVRRMKCVRCNAGAQFQWQICSDGNNFRPVCGKCDVELNKLVLEWMGHPRSKELMQRYERSKR